MKEKLGLGFKVKGWGKSVGTHKQDGTKTSSLHFGPEQVISPIKEGKGYWKYMPAEAGTIFLTQYDYTLHNKGVFGQFIDIFFRPLIGWGTALSFDVLKRWLEKGELPRWQYVRFCCNILISLLFCFIWVYQGLVPKILAHHPLEISMLSSLTSLTGTKAEAAVTIIGIAEIVFGVVWLLYRNKRLLHAIQLIGFPVFPLSAVIAEPPIWTHPFSPIAFNMSLWILSVVGFVFAKDAHNCD